MSPKNLIKLWYISDALLFIGSYALAYFLRVGFILSTDFPFEKYIGIVAIVSVFWLMTMGATGIFHITRNQLRLKNVQYILFNGVIGVAMFTLLYYFTYEQFFSRLLLIYALVLSTVVIALWHALFQNIMRSMLRSDPPAFPTLVIGVTRESKELIAKLNASRNPLKPVAILDGRGSHEKEIDGVPVLGKLNKLEEVLESHDITHMIQASDIEQSLNLLSACRNRKITYMMLPMVIGIVERDETIQSLEGHSVVVVRP